tara:strand:+ start:2391 stop:3608 length:1218 start_codon:yes stop_codon:yes gene_type:complete
MKINTKTLQIDKLILDSKNILLIQDIDGVCIPLVKDPMTRKLDKDYIFAAKQLQNEFFVLTCGEHDGRRGVNRIIETSIGNHISPREKGLYLRGLAACGVEYQNSKGEISFEGISEKEINFLTKVPTIMRPKFVKIVKELFPNMNDNLVDFHMEKSICDTRFSPTINFNSLFEIEKNNDKRRKIQKSFEMMMNEIILMGESLGLKNSFFLHISPNLGSKNGVEIIKESYKDDIGSTDIQLLLKGALKDSGVLFLLNKFIGYKTGKKPFGNNFNFRNSPTNREEKIALCKECINPKDMPLIIGVGDTVTSYNSLNKNVILRGGSDRSFLELIQLIGLEYGKRNKIIYVDSSYGEVFRPSTKDSGLRGISDEEDFLKFDLIFQNGPKEYINWFIRMSKERYQLRNKS